MSTTIGDIIFESSPFGCPNECGVYLVVAASPETKRKKVFYVGSSCNIKNRVSNRMHPYHVLFNRLGDFYVGIEYYLTSDYKNLEKRAIEYFNPVLNIQYSK